MFRNSKREQIEPYLPGYNKTSRVMYVNSAVAFRDFKYEASHV